MASSQFPKLFADFYTIHETIHGILSEGADLSAAEIERRVKERHPDIDMTPAALDAAIQRAMADTAPPLKSSADTRVAHGMRADDDRPSSGLRCS